MKIAILYYARENSFQYDFDWINAFQSFPDLSVEAFPVNKMPISEFKKLIQAEVIILMYSYDIIYYNKHTYWGVPIWRILNYYLKKRRGKLVFFGRNEFHRFPFRRDLIKKLQVDLMVSQLKEETSLFLYGDLTKTISLPHALNPSLFSSKQNFVTRPIKIGSRSADYPKFLLDNTRNSISTIITQLKEKKKNWQIDYETDIKKRFDRENWGKYLSSCQFTISSEAGAGFVEKDDKIVAQLKDMEYGRKKATMEEMEAKFKEKIKGLPSGKCISSRHFEAIGCRTAQILIEGDYNHILKPNEHYLSLKKDWSNLEEVIEKMEDFSFIQRMIETTYQYILDGHTHAQRIRYLINSLEI